MAWIAAKYAKENVPTTFLFSLTLLIGSAAFAQRYPILPVPNSPHGIFTLMQDHESRMWLGTIDDVYNFDGERFYSLRGAGFPREVPNSFAEDSRGAIWIGTQGLDALGGTGQGGLYRYDGGRVERIMSGDVLSVIAAGRDTMLASLSTEGSGSPAYGDLYLLRLHDGSWMPSKLLDKLVDHLTVDHQGNILFTCPGGWCELARGIIEQWTQNGQRITPVHHAGDPLAERVLRDRYGCVWTRAATSASYQCPTNPVPVKLSDDLSATDPTSHLEETADGSIFMLVRMILGRPGHFHVANFDNGLPDSMDTAIVARDGTIWIGSSSGLYRFMYPFQLQLWDSRTGVGSANSLVRFDGTIFAADHGLASLARNHMQWERVPAVEGISDIATASRDGNLFVVGSSGLIELDAGKTVKSVTPVSRGKWGTNLAATPDGTLWLGGDGLFRINAHAGRLSIQPESLPDPAVERNGASAAISDLQYEDVNRVLWACYGKRVLFNNGDGWKQITRRDGLLNENCSALVPLSNGNLWVGYSPANYGYIQNALSARPVVQNFNVVTDGPTANNGIGLFASDQRGRLWQRRAEGIYVAEQDAAKQQDWLCLDANDGVSFSGVLGHAFLADPDGSVWFAIQNGVAHFSPPGDFASSFPDPSVFVSGFSDGSGPSVLAGAQRAFSRRDAIEAYIGSLTFNRRNALQIRYRLLPAQSSWTTTRNLTIVLGKPGWGTHTLEIQGRLGTGRWSGTVSQVMVIPAPPWLSWPALTGFCLVCLGLSVSGWQWQRQLTLRQAKLSRALPDLAELRLSVLSPELQHLDSELLDGRFEVGVLLARGGFAAIVEGRDRTHGNRRCAIKIFRRDLGDSEWMDRRFHQEVLALEQIQHPNVVRIYGSGMLPGGTMYLVMEFIEGVTLRAQMLNGRLPILRIAAHLRQIGSALEAIHARGICHRDLKPDNLMLRRDAPPGQELVLIDFSIAIIKDPDKTVHGLSRAAGTISYMAPEQAIGYADPATDIYSLAKVLVEMIAGERLATLLPDASMDLPQRVSEFVRRALPGLSSKSVILLASALEFDPARRPHDAARFAEQIASDLERCVHGDASLKDVVSASPSPFPSGSEPDGG